MTMRLLSFILLINICFHINAQTLKDYLLPQPKHLSIDSGRLEKHKGAVVIESKVTQISKPILLLLNTFDQSGIEAQVMPIQAGYQHALLHAAETTDLSPQAYTLSITRQGIEIKGGSPQGIYYGLLSLQQIGRFAMDHGYWPTLYIEDEPDFERRGFMLDISRDKVPTMASLFSLVDQLAQWKINEFQLYTEHTFAYQNHQTVWKDASPMTAEQIKELDAYCRNHFIDLVPNQNSFGHMKRWLKHKEYEHLAELPQPGKTIWGMMSRTSLSPVEPGSLELMKELYAELLPNFTSRYFNIGCDETVELGVGKSKALCQEKGKGRVYLDFVLALKNEVDQYDRTTQFWGDIILHHPELIPELPKDMVALIWGYDAKHPFDTQCWQFKKAGLPYYVCPGTSSWNSIIGRNKNGFANLKNAAINGQKHGAKGFLNTSWGDQGHWQPISVSYPGILYGAVLSWNVNNNADIDIARHYAMQVLKDTTGQNGQAIVNLGYAHLRMKAPCDNSNIFHQILKRNKRSIKTDRWLKHLKESNVDASIKFIEEELEQLNNSAINSSDNAIVLAEMNQAAKLALHACHLAKSKLNTSDGYFKSIPSSEKQKLRAELQELIDSHKEIWLLRNRIGGLSDSAAKLEAVLRSYQ
jgi:hypothetical protein